MSKTVLLETERVLRSAFGSSSDDVARALRGLIGLPDVRCEDAPAVAAAVDALDAGLDFADALHLTGSRPADDGFASFDACFVKRARKLWPDVAIRTP